MGINGLAILVEQALGMNPFAAAVYVFSNRQRNRVKILVWERNGFWWGLLVFSAISDGTKS